jgi:hypothetical protein
VDRERVAVRASLRETSVDVTDARGGTIERPTSVSAMSRNPTAVKSVTVILVAEWGG